MIVTDNSTVVAYIKKQGGTKSRSLWLLTQTLYKFLEEHQIRVLCRHIPGRLNVLADRLSRQGQILPTEWTVHPNILEAVWLRWDKPLIDLFATRDNRQLPMYVSPIPDQQAWKVDALSFSWDGLFVYAFPPTAILRAVLDKVASSTCVMILIAPFWPKQPWFPALLELVIDHPRALPPWRSLLKQPHSTQFHSNPEVYSLHAWILSSDPIRRGDFLRKQLRKWPGHKNLPPSVCTRESGFCSVIGVQNEALILSMPLLE
jgi:hypothetical protein